MQGNIGQFTPVKEFIHALRGNHWNAVAEAMKNIEGAGLWPEAIATVVRLRLVPHGAIAEAFHTYWTERGFRIRACVANDALMVDALWLLLPRYSGPGLILYRGENLDRWDLRKIGFGWTSRQQTAAMFARGLAASEGRGGILIRADVPSHAIITGPGKHSQYLGEDEYIIDPRHLQSLTALEQFPRIG